MTKTLYFAYGSNLNITDLARYCKAEGLDASCLQPVGNALLPDYELSFSHYSQKRKGGALNVVPRTGNAVEGQLFEASAIGWQALDHKEGAHCGRYERQVVHVLTASGDLIEAQTYIKQVGANPPHFPPTKRYVDAVRAGLKTFGLDTKMLDKAAKNEPLPVFCDAVFVYGSLMRSQSKFSILDEFGITCCLLAEAPGKLVDCGIEPAMSYCDRQFVRGEFVKLRNFVAAIEHFDSMHGFQGFGAGSRQTRKLVSVDVGDGRERLAWAYLLATPEKHLPIASGCWRQHCGETSYFQRLVQAHLKGMRLSDLVARLRRRLPFEAELADFPDSIERLAEALATGRLSERILAQASDQWVARF